MTAYSDKIEKQKKRGYFRTVDLEEIKELTLTIAYLVEDAPVFDDIKDVLHFSDDGRQLQMNVTNSETLIELLGDEPTNWAGHKITLYLTTYPTKNGDKPCIRLRAPATGNGTAKPVRLISTTTAQRTDLDDEIPF